MSQETAPLGIGSLFMASSMAFVAVASMRCFRWGLSPPRGRHGRLKRAADRKGIAKDGLLHVLKYLTMCTATLTQKMHSLTLKYGAEDAAFDGERGRTRVGNGAAIAAVLMCGGIVRAADWPNAFLTVRAPKTCGVRNDTGCGRYMSGNTRFKMCSSCRRIPYVRRATAGFWGPVDVIAKAGGRVPARVQDAFPPESDLFGLAPLPPVGVERNGAWLEENRERLGILP